MNSIAFGRYTPYETFTHHLDARNKILLVILLIVGIFFQFTIWSTTIAMSLVYLIIFILFMIVSKVPVLGSKYA